MANRTTPSELPAWRLTIYGLPALPLSFLFVPLTALLPAFYARELGISLATVGGILLLSRVSDFVIDPLLGRWSDHTHTRFGRRRPWMVAATPIMMLGAWLVFMPPEGAGGLHLLIATSVIYMGASMLGLSYSAWGAEIVESYHGRSKVAGFRETANVLGILIASSVPAVTAMYGHNIDRFTMGVMGWMVIIMTPLTVAAALKWIPETKTHVRTTMPLLRTMATLFKNKPFRLLCIGFFVLNIGATVANTTLIFFISSYLGQPELIGPVLLVSFGFVLLGVPLWVAISRRIGKHRAAGISLLIAVCLNSVLTLQLQPGDGHLFVVLMALLGATSSAFLTLPIGMVGDIIDYDTLKTGHARGGLYFGVWSFFLKVSPAIAVGGALTLLQLFGFSATQDNSPEALQGLRYMYCLGPLPFFLVGAFMFLTFPIDARRHDIIRRRLESRSQRAHDAARNHTPALAEQNPSTSPKGTP